jgi:hypothetical protein
VGIANENEILVAVVALGMLACPQSVTAANKIRVP